jgi:hypothetical protein
MTDRLSRIGLVALLGIACVPGCTPRTGKSSKEEEESIRSAVIAFQAALKSGDAEKVWSLLDSDSQADAERAAKAVQDAYAGASPQQRVEQEKALGLPGAELAALTGAGFLKTKRFRGKYDEVPDSKIDGVTVQGDKATVVYTEPDGDHEKMTLVRQEGRWKLSLQMPKITQP